MKRDFGRDVIGADNHFEWGRDNLSSPKFYCTYAHRGKRGAEGALAELPKKKARMNAALVDARGRIEAPFGIVKGAWKALSRPWLESDLQQEQLVSFAFGVHSHKS